MFCSPPGHADMACDAEAGEDGYYLRCRICGVITFNFALP